MRRLHQRPELRVVGRLRRLLPELAPAHVDRRGRAALDRLRELTGPQPRQQLVHVPQALPAPPGRTRPDDVPEVRGGTRDHLDPLARAGDAEPAPLGADVDVERLAPGDGGGDPRRGHAPMARQHRDVQRQLGRRPFQDSSQASGGGEVGVELSIHPASMAIRLPQITTTADRENGLIASLPNPPSGRRFSAAEGRGSGRGIRTRTVHKSIAATNP